MPSRLHTTQQRRGAAGLCLWCAVPVTGRTYCQECMDHKGTLKDMNITPEARAARRQRFTSMLEREARRMLEQWRQQQHQLSKVMEQPQRLGQIIIAHCGQWHVCHEIPLHVPCCGALLLQRTDTSHGVQHARP